MIISISVMLSPIWLTRWVCWYAWECIKNAWMLISDQEALIGLTVLYVGICFASFVTYGSAMIVWNELILDKTFDPITIGDMRFLYVIASVSTVFFGLITVMCMIGPIHDRIATYNRFCIYALRNLFEDK